MAEHERFIKSDGGGFYQDLSDELIAAAAENNMSVVSRHLRNPDIDKNRRNSVS